MIIFKVLDYFIIILFFSITLFNEICVYKKDAQDFFLSSKTNPWLLLSCAIPALIFLTDIFSFIANTIDLSIISGNCVCWVLLLTVFYGILEYETIAYIRGKCRPKISGIAISYVVCNIK